MKSVERQIIEAVSRIAQCDGLVNLRFGIGDDTAVYVPPKGEDLLLTTDQVVEGTHFERGIHPAHALGYKTIARAVSDIAAMGGRSLCCLLSLCLPEWTRSGWFRYYLQGLSAAIGRFNTPIVGGDVARGEKFNATLSAVGSVPQTAALTRYNAEPGDRVYVSGLLGGSALGLKILREGGSSRRAAVRRHLYPEPRLSLGRFLRNEVGASAAIDLSDGLSSDVARLALASSVAIEIDALSIPCYRGCSVDDAIVGGEDYELLFTVPAEVKVPVAFDHVPLTKIGKIRTGSGVKLKTESGLIILQDGGFHHFESQ